LIPRVPGTNDPFTGSTYWRPLLSWVDVYGTPPLPGTLENMLAKLPRLGTARLLSKWNSTTSKTSGEELDGLQRGIVIALSRNHPLRDTILQTMNVSSLAYIVGVEHSAALGVLAALHCGDSMPDVGEADAILLDVILAYNFECVGRLADTDRRSLQTELRSVPQSSERWHNAILRYHDFLEWTRESGREMAAKLGVTDLDVLLRSRTGLSYEESAAAVHAISRQFGWIPGNRGSLLRIADIVPDHENQQVLRRFIELWSQSLDELRLYIGSSDLEAFKSRWTSVLLRRPILALDDGLYMIPSRTFLENTIGAGLYFRLQDCVVNHQELRALRQLFGAFFEQNVLSFS
ncbi:MAG: hypothetical protein QOJ39_683, partial [Candidatus Eremiobacteraeota bacterium]|nr:hypothetical protein [Candidatus Eremiobacteraeota bacterium]